VTLISGPTALPCPTGVTCLDITSAADMLAASLAHPGDIYIAAAAVADYRVAQPAAHKQKKQGDNGLTLQLVQNPDIVATIAALRENRPYTVGFAAETDNVLAYARDKRARKNLDLIIANDVSRDVFGADDNAATLIAADGETTLPRQAKTTLADSLLTHILSHWKKT
jgi:phosphopantothenoylcysteine decarboxylase/phosphopantothenate--cysteine ligase